MATEHEDLDQFIRSQGWLRFTQHAEKEWGQRFQDLIKVAISDRDDDMALRRLQQVLVAKEAVEQLLKWPTERLAELDRATETHLKAQQLSRRGSL